MGSIINTVGSLAIDGVLIVVGGAICALFGADAATLDYTVRVMPLYSWGFVAVGLTTSISSYLYSTKCSREADVISILRSFVFNTIVIVLLISAGLLKRSERGGSQFN